MAQTEETVSAITAMLTGKMIEELREARLWPSAAQWARARALADAEAWVEHVTAGELDEPEGPTSVEAQAAIELLAQRWSAWIESGEFPA